MGDRPSGQCPVLSEAEGHQLTGEAWEAAQARSQQEAVVWLGLGPGEQQDCTSCGSCPQEGAPSVSVRKAKMGHVSRQGLRERGRGPAPGKEKPARVGPPKKNNGRRDSHHNSSCFVSACWAPGFMLHTICHLGQQGQEDGHGERPGH